MSFATKTDLLDSIALEARDMGIAPRSITLAKLHSVGDAFDDVTEADLADFRSALGSGDRCEQCGREYEYRCEFDLSCITTM